MIRCYVTDRRQGDVPACAARAIRQGVDMIQVREKDLPAAELFDLLCRIKNLAAGTSTKVLVNDRLDIALAAGLDGVHLPEDGLPALRVRPHVRMLGVSVHSVDAALSAQNAGADFVIFGPVFETPGKRAVGLEALRKVANAVHIQVLGIGGIRMDNAPSVMGAGAAGIAAIRLDRKSVV